MRFWIPQPAFWCAILASLMAPAAMSSPASAAPPPRPQAAAWVVFAPGYGGVLAGANLDAERPVASLTKLMTARLAISAGALDRVTTVSANAASIPESVVGLAAGERQRIRDLVEALIVYSGNDAAIAIAEAVAGSEAAFVTRMNAEAARIGLRHTAYRTPHGLDTAGAHSSARDVLTLSIAAMRDPFFRSFARATSGAIPGHTFPSRNLLLTRYAGFDGVKTGHTDGAGWCLAASAERNGVRLYVVVLGAPDEAQRDADVARLLDWGFARFQEVRLVQRGQPAGSLAVPWSDARIPVVAGRGLARIVRPGQRLREQIVLPAHASLPLRAGQRVGTLTLRAGKRVVGQVPLVATRGADAPGLGERAGWLVGRALDIALGR
jgi:serine-type D-Ala-D-Ala carboxypeptidase (penicillin-binding protein 5/6)